MVLRDSNRALARYESEMNRRKEIVNTFLQSDKRLAFTIYVEKGENNSSSQFSSLITNKKQLF